MKPNKPPVLARPRLTPARPRTTKANAWLAARSAIHQERVKAKADLDGYAASFAERIAATFADLKAKIATKRQACCDRVAELTRSITENREAKQRLYDELRRELAPYAMTGIVGPRVKELVGREVKVIEDKFATARNEIETNGDTLERERREFQNHIGLLDEFASSPDALTVVKHLSLADYFPADYAALRALFENVTRIKVEYDQRDKETTRHADALHPRAFTSAGLRFEVVESEKSRGVGFALTLAEGAVLPAYGGVMAALTLRDWLSETFDLPGQFDAHALTLVVKAAAERLREGRADDTNPNALNVHEALALHNAIETLVPLTLVDVPGAEGMGAIVEETANASGDPIGRGPV